jgi:hypothetical protein
VGANAAVGKYVVVITLLPNGSASTDFSDSVSLRVRVQ